MRLIDIDDVMIVERNPDVFIFPETAYGWNECLEIFRNAPTVDAVPVVRCKDCVYHYYAVDCAGMCKLGIGNSLLDDDFCSRGIRKGDADMREVQDG